MLPESTQHVPFFAKNHVKARPSLAFAESVDLFEFAKEAKAMLQSKLCLLNSPTLRVDIMRTQSGKLVVNEFESFEALICASGQTQFDGHTANTHTDTYMDTFNYDFWGEKIRQVLSNFML